MEYHEAINLIRKHIPEPEAGRMCVWLEDFCGGKNKLSKDVCPNCSLPGNPFFLSPIPVDFVKLENATHECTKCKYKKPI